MLTYRGKATSCSFSNRHLIFFYTDCIVLDVGSGGVIESLELFKLA